MADTNTAPSPWSKVLPRLQLAWDATSLNALMFCARRYYYSIIEGWRASGVDLEFGGFYASAVERYKRSRLLGYSKEQAQLDTLRWLLEVTWSEKTGPWGGHYEEQWHCTGVTKYKNARGNAAKCPYAHKGAWFPGTSPDTCGECGSPIERRNNWVGNHKIKDRYTLVRAFTWWSEDQPDDLRDGLAALNLPNGDPAVELSVKMPLPWSAGTGEAMLVAGHLDDISAMGIETFVVDQKTTGKPLTDMYWAQFTPNTQVNTYDLLANTLFSPLGIKGVIIDAVQILKGGVIFGKKPFYRTEQQREEWLGTMKWWMEQAERYARAEHWPMNTANCKFCEFNGVCSKNPDRREDYLRTGFEKRYWNPLEER